MPRKYTKARKETNGDDDPSGPSVNARGTGTRGAKKKRTVADIGMRDGPFGNRTVVASNPFDDDHQSSPASNAGAKTPLGNTHSPAPPQIHSPYVTMPPNYMQQMPPMSHQHLSTPPTHLVDGHPPMQHSNQPPPMHPSQHYNPYQNRCQDYSIGPPMGGPPSSMTSSHIDHQQPHHQPPPSHMAMGPYNSINCARCGLEIYQDQPNIRCEASCQSHFHRTCSGLTDMAFDLLQRETYAEWACEGCVSSGKRIPMVRYKQQNYGPQPVYVQQ